MGAGGADWARVAGQHNGSGQWEAMGVKDECRVV